LIEQSSVQLIQALNFKGKRIFWFLMKNHITKLLIFRLKPDYLGRILIKAPVNALSESQQKWGRI